MGLQEAVDRLYELILRAEHDFYTAHDQALTSPAGRRAHVRTYLHGLEIFAAGFLRFASISGRYNGSRRNLNNAVTADTAILHPDHPEYRCSR